MGYFYDKKVLSFIKTEFLPANLQEKVITPQNQTHFITPDFGYSALSKVTLNGLLVDTHQSYTSQTDSTVAYQKTTPTGALKYASLDKVGGMSWKINQLVQNGNFVDDTGWNANQAFGTSVVANNKLTYTITAKSGSQSLVNTSGYRSDIVSGHKYLVCATMTCSQNATVSVELDTATSITTFGNLTANVRTTLSIILTVNASSTNKGLYIYPYYSGSGLEVGSTISFENIMLIDLTQMFGDGNEPSDVATATTELLKRGIDITTYNEYNEGTIRDSAVTSIVSKDSNNTTLDTKTINASIQALEGYGWGINDTCYNYIGFENKKFIQKVGRVNLETLTWYTVNVGVYSATITKADNKTINNAEYTIVSTYQNMLATDKTIYVGGTANQTIYVHDSSNTPRGYMLYELATPIETDISEYIDNNFIEVEPNGTTTFNNTYNQAVPSEVTYLVGVTE